MFFSICIPTYNRAEYIVRALQSLSNQTFKDFEVIVVDDGSTDDTHQRVMQFDDPRFKYVKKENGGKHSALNLAVDLAQGYFFLILDSDDFLREFALQRFVDLWNNAKNKDFLCGIMCRCAENGKMIGIPFEKKTISYIEFHFGPNGGKYRDCCECIKLSLLKSLKWPESAYWKFIPEAYVYDKIGLSYDMICSNDILEDKVYLSTGITKNKFDYLKENAAGYLFDIVDKIENIFPKAQIRFKFKVVIWWKYWRLVKLDKNKYGSRCKHISLLGFLVWLAKPFLDLIKG